MGRIFAILALSASLVGCHAEHFDLESPADFLVLEEPRTSQFAFRATSADGVRLGVRDEENRGHGSRAFWEQAIRNQLRYEGGYAIASEAPLRAATGEPGTLFRCGKDQHGRTYDYWIAVFVTEDRVFMIEAGGPRPQFEPVAATVEAALGSFRIE